MAQQQQSTTSSDQEQSTSSNGATSGAQSASQTQGAASGGPTTQASLAGMQGGAGNQAAVEEMSSAQASEEGSSQDGSGGGAVGGDLESLPPIPPIGSAVVLAAAGENEWAFEGGLSVKLNELLIANPAVPLSDLLKQAAEAEYGGKDPDQKDVHADVAVVGTLPSEDADTKNATLVANQNYDESDELGEAIGETQALAGTLRGEGFDDLVYVDQKAADIEAYYSIEMNDAKAGDEVVLGFSGHGDKEGLTGVDEETVSHGTINSFVSQALSEGVHLRVILDACHTGTGTNLIRDEYESAAIDKPALLSNVYDQCEVVYDALQANHKKRDDLYWEKYWDNTATYLKADWDLFWELKEDLKGMKAQIEKGKATWKKRIAGGAPEKRDKLTAIAERWEATETTKYEQEKLALDTHEAKLDALAEELQQNKDLMTDRGWSKVFDDAADEIWKNSLDNLTYIAEAAEVDAPHTDIEDYRTYGAELSYIGNLKQLIIDAISSV